MCDYGNKIINDKSKNFSTYKIISQNIWGVYPTHQPNCATSWVSFHGLGGWVGLVSTHVMGCEFPNPTSLGVFFFIKSHIRAMHTLYSTLFLLVEAPSILLMLTYMEGKKNPSSPLHRIFCFSLK